MWNNWGTSQNSTKHRPWYNMITEEEIFGGQSGPGKLSEGVRIWTGRGGWEITFTFYSTTYTHIFLFLLSRLTQCTTEEKLWDVEEKTWTLDSDRPGSNANSCIPILWIIEIPAASVSPCTKCRGECFRGLWEWNERTLLASHAKL